MKYTLLFDFFRPHHLDSPMVPKVVITGAPASGKTEFIERLRKHDSFNRFLFFDELARRLLRENPEYRTDWNRFHDDIYRLQIARENEAGDRPFISDRGTVDIFAFHPKTTKSVGTTIEKEFLRYSDVIHLGSSAILGESYYQADPIRTEPVEKAIEIETALKAVWEKHPGYCFIPALVDYEEKFDNFLTIMNIIAQ